MNIFATIKLLKKASAVTIYTVALETEDDQEAIPETEKFFDRFIDSVEHKSDFDEIREQIRQISIRGLSRTVLRFENDAQALPAKRGEIVTRSFKPHPDVPLRLYCTIVSDEVLVLCNGGIKTTQRVQDFPNVSTHFRLANQVAKKIKERLREEPKPLNREMIEAALEDFYFSL